MGGGKDEITVLYRRAEIGEGSCAVLIAENMRRAVDPRGNGHFYGNAQHALLCDYSYRLSSIVSDASNRILTYESFLYNLKQIFSQFTKCLQFGRLRNIQSLFPVNLLFHPLPSCFHVVYCDDDFLRQLTFHAEGDKAGEAVPHISSYINRKKSDEKKQPADNLRAAGKRNGIAFLSE
ncbi:MAG TPA: hypothetical protein VHO71_05030 [Caproiciproducens sp.]|nr:hypothetical protein [Caproiciproducens sp.]